MGPQRPNLLGLICWILIIGGFYGLVQAMKATGGDAFFTSMQGYPYPPLAAEILQFATRALLVITGILLYERQGWARYLYVIVVPVFFVHAYFTVKHMNVPPLSPSAAHKFWIYQHTLYLGVLIFFASIVYLFLRPVQRYYHPPQYIDEN